MKNIKSFITHPLTIILLFSILIISGEQMGGVYLFYILIGLPHFALHSVLGFLGIICLIGTNNSKTKTIFLLRGVSGLLMVGSLLCFFLQKQGSYNYNTFHEVFPFTMLMIFSMVLIAFIVKNSWLFINSLSHNQQHAA